MSVALEIRDVSKTYGTGDDAKVVLQGVDFDVQPGEFVCVVGPSGCGKTTLLSCIAGLMSPSRGGVDLGGRRVDSPPRELAVVFQDYSRSLYPWFTVEKNVAFPLKGKKMSRAEREARVGEAIEAVGLTQARAQRPYQLSGGMQQRVAIARALAYRPEVLLMDEPFASVDAQTRAELEDLTLSMRDRYGITVLFITHDIDESVYMADRVVVLTKPPTSVRQVLGVDLPFPRDQVATKALPEFAQLRAQVYGLIRDAQPEVPAPPPEDQAQRASTGQVSAGALSVPRLQRAPGGVS